MSKFRKYLAFAVALVMSVGMVVPAMAFTVAPDVAGTKYEEAAATLGALGIMVGDAGTGAFRPEDTIIRSEFAKIAVTAMGLEAVAHTSKGISKFPDVSTEHWANGYINVAASQKIIIGDDVGTFRPDDTITYQEAVTIMTRVLGYEPAALAKGGYPTGYLVVAEQTGITRRANAPANSGATRGITALMAFNSLTIKLMEQTGFGNDLKYEVVDKTLLEDKLMIEKQIGTVTGNTYTRLDGPSSLRLDEVEIGTGNILKVGDTKAAELLGQNVIYYAKKDDNSSDKILVLITPDENKNSSIEILAKDVTNELDGQTTAIKYLPEDKHIVQTAELDQNYKVIYNSKATSTLQKPVNGKIVLLDTNRNEKYNVVFIEEHVNYVVEDISVAGKKIFDKYGMEALDLDTTANKDLKVSLVDTDGNAVKLEDLKEWDVLSVYKNTNYVKAIVSKQVVSGTVSELSHNKVKIGSSEYEVASNLEFSDIRLDLEGKFYLDMEGKIAAYDATAKINDNYAYLIAADITDSMNSVLEMKLFTAKGETKILKAANRIKIDDTNSLTATAALAELKGGDANVQPMFITYDTNSSGEVSNIQRAADKTAQFPQSFVKTGFSLNLEGEGLVYKSASKKLNAVDVDGNIVKSVNVGAGTVVFDIPKDETDTENMEVRTSSMFNDGSTYDVLVYDMSEDMTAGVIRVTSSVNVGKLESPIAVVDRVTEVRNDDGVIVDRLYAMVNGQAVTETTSSKGVLVKNGSTMLAAGDIIQYSKNVKGELDKFDILFNASEKDVEFTKNYGDEGEMEIVYGRVTKRFTGSINVSVDGGSDMNYATGSAMVYSFDSAKNSAKVTLSSAGEIQRWEDGVNEARVFIRIYKDQVKEIVIVK